MGGRFGVTAEVMGSLDLHGRLTFWRHESVPVYSRKMGWLTVVTQEMRIENVDRPRTPRMWTVTVYPADPLCTLVLPAPYHETKVCCSPPGSPTCRLPFGFSPREARLDRRLG